MLDPLSALSLASSVVQFVDFGIKLVSEGSELYQRGSLKSNDEIELATRDLTQLAEDLAAPLENVPVQPGTRVRLPSKQERSLQQLAESCKELADQLLSTLEDLKPRDRQNGLESFRKALNSRKKVKVRDIEKRLKKMQDQLAIHLLSIMKNKQSTLVSTLDELVENCRQSETNTSHKIDYLATQIRQSLQMVDQASAGRNDLFVNIGSMCQNLTGESNRVIATQRILESLYFKSIASRQSAIKQAHKQTFKWIFTESTNVTSPKSSFVRWMESGNGIYWISGKAGSGKSTLVKFLCSSEETTNALQTWAGASKLVVPSYFFWSAGNTLQKSQEGLLQSLLFQILRQCENLIPKICPARWKDALNSNFQEPWTLQELSEALNCLAKEDLAQPPAPAVFHRFFEESRPKPSFESLESKPPVWRFSEEERPRPFFDLPKQGLLPAKFCFFVDGLDEYDGEHIDIINILESFAASPSIKLCVSSRPWNVFQVAFGGANPKKLLLQDFTRGDIRAYVESTLQDDGRFKILMAQDDRYKLLIEEIVDRAQGVFLWVYLVIRSLLRGLTDDNDIETLQRRLRFLPADLETYFKQMLTTIEDVYQEQTAQIFQLTVHAKSPLSTMAFWFLEKEKNDPDYALKTQITKILDAEVVEISNKMQTHLNARCKDLIEINTTHAEKINLIKYKVDFLHRTVRDFLMTKDMQNLLQSRVPTRFDARVSLCTITLAQTKSLAGLVSFVPSAPSACTDSALEMLAYAHEVETYNGLPEVALLDELERVLEHAEMAAKPVKSESKLIQTTSSQISGGTFLAMATEAGLHLYVAHKIDNKSDLLSKGRQPLLGLACGLNTSGYGPKVFGQSRGETDVNIDIDMVHVLIDRGADPNQKLSTNSDRTIWEAFLHHCYTHRQEYSRDPPKQLFQAAEMFIIHGADPDVDVESHVTEELARRNTKWGHKTVTVMEKHYVSPSQVLKEVLRPAQYDQIRELLAQKQAAKRRNRRTGIWNLMGRK